MGWKGQNTPHISRASAWGWVTASEQRGTKQEKVWLTFSFF